MKNVKRLFWIISFFCANYLSVAQTSKTPIKDPVKPAEVAAEKKVEKKSKDYDQVITKEAKSQKGIF